MCFILCCESSNPPIRRVFLIHFGTHTHTDTRSYIVCLYIIEYNLYTEYTHTYSRSTITTVIAKRCRTMDELCCTNSQMDVERIKQHSLFIFIFILGMRWYYFHDDVVHWCVFGVLFFLYHCFSVWTYWEHPKCTSLWHDEDAVQLRVMIICGICSFFSDSYYWLLAIICCCCLKSE